MRPSSAAGAKASTVRPLSLDLFTYFQCFLSIKNCYVCFLQFLLSYYLFLTIKKDNIYLLFGFQRTIFLRDRSLRVKQKPYFQRLYLGLLFFFLLRKEVIHPHVLVGIPCYDLTPITGPALDGSLLAVRPPALGIANSHGLTGGVYKTRERIHRGVLIHDY